MKTTKRIANPGSKTPQEILDNIQKGLSSQKMIIKFINFDFLLKNQFFINFSFETSTGTKVKGALVVYLQKSLLEISVDSEETTRAELIFGIVKSIISRAINGNPIGVN
ncbi:MAG: hypothetical protein WC089_00140 [Candidatus Paceibacterota bacterium]